MIPVVDATAALSYLLDQVYLNPPAIVQEGSNNLSRLSSFFPDLTDLRVTSTADIRVGEQALYQTVDPWVVETLQAVAGHRNLSKGWDGQSGLAPSSGALDTAEILTQAFAFAPASSRPVFSVDADGRPSFSSYNDDLYLHLTVDDPGVISWYSVRNGEDDFRDNVKVDGFNLEALAAEILTTV